MADGKKFVILWPNHPVTMFSTGLVVFVNRKWDGKKEALTT